MSTAVVVDAGRIIHLAEVDSLAFLNLFQRLHIPDEVWHETVGQQRVTIEQVQVLRSLQRITVPASDCEYFIQQNDLLHLHRGELECLYLCHSQRIDTLLTDDLAVRDAAKTGQPLGVGQQRALGVSVASVMVWNLTLRTPTTLPIGSSHAATIGGKFCPDGH